MVLSKLLNRKSMSHCHNREAFYGTNTILYRELNVTEQDLIEAKATAETFTLEGVRAV